MKTITPAAAKSLATSYCAYVRAQELPLHAPDRDEMIRVWAQMLLDDQEATEVEMMPRGLLLHAIAAAKYRAARAA